MQDEGHKLLETTLWTSSHGSVYFSEKGKPATTFQGGTKLVLTNKEIIVKSMWDWLSFVSARKIRLNWIEYFSVLECEAPGFLKNFIPPTRTLQVHYVENNKEKELGVQMKKENLEKWVNALRQLNVKEKKLEEIKEEWKTVKKTLEQEKQPGKADKKFPKTQKPLKPGW
jgi:hypothetical protein